MKKKLFLSVMFLVSGAVVASDAGALGKKSSARTARCPRVYKRWEDNPWLSFDRITGELYGQFCDPSGKLPKVPGVIHNGNLSGQDEQDVIFDMIYSPAPGNGITKEQSHEWALLARAAIKKQCLPASEETPDN